MHLATGRIWRNAPRWGWAVLNYVVGLLLFVLASMIAPASGNADPAAQYLPRSLTSDEVAGAKDLFADPRLRMWAGAFHNLEDRDLPDLLQQIEADLTGAAPHPMTIHVWYAVQQALGQADATRLPPLPDGLTPEQRARKDIALRIFQRDEYRSGDDFTDLALAALENDLSDYWSFFFLVSRVQAEMRAPVAARAVALYPHDFGIAFALWRGNHEVEYPDGTAGARLFQWLNETPDAAPQDIRIAVRAWLEHSPHDSNALRRLFYLYYDTGDYPDAIAQMMAADSTYPFLSLSDVVLRAMAWIGQFDASDAFAETLSRRLFAGSSLARDIMRVTQYRTAGHLGRARDIALTERQDHPDDQRLALALAEVVSAEGRPAEAVEILLPLAGATLPMREVHMHLAKSLNDTGRHAEAAQVVQAWASSGQRYSDNQIHQWREALFKSGRGDDALRLTALVQRDAPEAEFLLSYDPYYLAEMGRHGAALDVLLALLDQGKVNAWRLGRIEEFSRITGRESEALAMLTRYIGSNPQSAAAWRHLAALSPDPESVWQEARVAAPYSAFAWTMPAQVLTQAQPPDRLAARRLLDDGVLALSEVGAPPGEIARIYDYVASVRDEAISAAELSARPHAEQVLDDIEMARAAGLHAREYWDQRRRALRHLGPSKELTEAVLRAHELGDAQAYQQLFEGDAVENLGSAALAFVAAHETLARTPREAARLRDVANRHARWGGSPVVALALLEQSARLEPAVDVDGFRAAALDQLGLYREAYALQYARVSSVSASDRYVGWLETSRIQARQYNQNILSRLDFDTSSVVLRHPDGVMEERRYHPITGRLTYLRVGAAWMEMQYLDGVDVELIRDGSGRSARLFYDDEQGRRPGDRPIIRVEVDGERAIDFRYGPGDRPVLIRIEGLGELGLVWNNDGDLQDIDARPENETITSLQMSSQLSVAFQRLQSMVTMSQSALDFNALPFDDPELDDLRASSAARSGDMAARIALGLALYDRRAARPGHAAEALSIATEVFFETAGYFGDGDTPQEDEARAAVGLFHAMAQELYEVGLPNHEWNVWAEMIQWLADPKTPEAHELAARIADQPLSKLAETGWMRDSFLSNPGLWRHHQHGSVVPPAIAGLAPVRAVLARGNGDLVVGTQRGLSVMRRGFWEWHGFATSEQAFSPNAAADRLDAASTILALHEDDAGRLWLGTGAGLMRIDAGYGAPSVFWRSGADGMPDGGVSALASDGRTLWFGGPGGVGRVDLMAGDSAAPVAMGQEPALWLRMIYALPDRPATIDAAVAVGRNDRVDLISADGTEVLVNERLADVIDWQGRIFALRGTQMLEAHFSQDAPVRLSLVPGQEGIAQSGQVFGFSPVPVFHGEAALGVRTDQGLSIWRDAGFEHLDLPGQDRVEPMPLIHAAGMRLIAATPRGISVMAEADARLAFPWQALGLLTRDDLGATLLWSERDGIWALDHRNPMDIMRPLLSWRTTAVANGPDGTLLANDDARIMRMRVDPEHGLVDEEVLFEAHPSQGWGGRGGRVRQILTDREDTIWVLTAESLFRLRAGESRPREFSVFLQQPDFDVRSDMLSRLIETTDGRMLLVASNEGHRVWNGIVLRGGLFEYDGEGFVPARDEVTGGWLLTGYTPIGAGRAIVGTNSGFALHSHDRLESYRLAEDASYVALHAREPSLLLGTDGVELGEGLFLFGSAGGIVGYRDGTWFLPERLNWMLPGQAHAAYGARAIRALETDPMGRLYIATDFGVTIYDPRGAGPEALLMNEALGNFAFAAIESRNMAQVGDILLEALPENSDAGRRLADVRALRARLGELEAELEQSRALGGGNSAAIERQLVQLRQRDIALLADLERNEPVLFSMLQINPLDLQALARELPDDTAVLQFLPGERTLYLNLMARDGQQIRQVEVGRDALEDVARRVALGLAQQAASAAVANAALLHETPGLPAIVGAAPEGPENDLANVLAALLGGEDDAQPPPAENPEAEPQLRGGTPIARRAQNLEEDLAWLYDQLLRPVEHALQAYDRILVAPAGVLSYVPPGALLRDRNGPRPRYAVEDFVFANASSLYTLQSQLRHISGMGVSDLVFGDPDGSLPAARDEAVRVAQLLGGESVTLRTGEAATREALLDNVADARFVHLAMHGKLDPLSPRDSYLLLADDYRMSLPEIMTLPLRNADLVFLSACETGLGVDGIEHRTIAQAFNHAGAPTIIASHWAVSDAATNVLALGFYAAMENGASPADALAIAQRAMLAEDGGLAMPGAWAGFSVFGRP